jgi:hypothetical protein
MVAYGKVYSDYRLFCEAGMNRDRRHCYGDETDQTRL